MGGHPLYVAVEASPEKQLCSRDLIGRGHDDQPTPTVGSGKAGDGPGLPLSGVGLWHRAEHHVGPVLSTGGVSSRPFGHRPVGDDEVRGQPVSHELLGTRQPLAPTACEDHHCIGTRRRTGGRPDEKASGDQHHDGESDGTYYCEASHVEPSGGSRRRSHRVHRRTMSITGRLRRRDDAPESDSVRRWTTNGSPARSAISSVTDAGTSGGRPQSTVVRVGAEPVSSSPVCDAPRAERFGQILIGIQGPDIDEGPRTSTARHSASDRSTDPVAIGSGW